MAALSADYMDCPYQGDSASAIREGAVIASETIYRNSLLAFAAAGGVRALTGDLDFAGISAGAFDNSSGAIGDVRVRYIGHGAILFRGLSGMVVGNDGRPMYCATDNPADITATATSATFIGTQIEFVSATEVVIELAGPGAKDNPT